MPARSDAAHRRPSREASTTAAMASTAKNALGPRPLPRGHGAVITRQRSPVRKMTTSTVNADARSVRKRRNRRSRFHST